MDDAFADAYIWIFQSNGRNFKMFKQADTVAKQKGNQVDVDFVEQPQVEALLHKRRRIENQTLLSSLLVLACYSVDCISSR